MVPLGALREYYKLSISQLGHNDMDPYSGLDNLSRCLPSRQVPKVEGRLAVVQDARCADFREPC